MKDNLLCSKFICLNMNPPQTASIEPSSRMFDQIAGRHDPAGVTHTELTIRIRVTLGHLRG